MTDDLMRYSFFVIGECSDTGVVMEDDNGQWVKYADCRKPVTDDLLHAVERVLERQAYLEDLPPTIKNAVVTCALRDLRAAHAKATHDPCKRHREGKVCGRCPYDPCCTE